MHITFTYDLAFQSWLLPTHLTPIHTTYRRATATRRATIPLRRRQRY